MKEWERVIRFEFQSSFAYHHTTRPIVHCGHSIREAFRTIQGDRYRLMVVPPGYGPVPDHPVENPFKPDLPDFNALPSKRSMNPEIPPELASRLLNRFHDIMRTSTQGAVRLNEWVIHERVLSDQIINSRNLNVIVPRRLTTLAFQISSSSGHISRLQPVPDLSEGVSTRVLEPLLKELTASHSPQPSSGRYQAILSGDVMSAVIKTIKPLLRSGYAFPFHLPPGWILKDDPLHPAAYQHVQLDAEGRLTRRMTIWKEDQVAPITDTLTARRRSLEPTAHAARPSIAEPPRPEFHNLYLDGPEKKKEEIFQSWGSGLHLLRPLHVHFTEKNLRLQLLASGYFLKGSEIQSYHPVITCRFTLKDFFKNLSGTLGEVRFSMMDGPIGSPDCFVGNLNVY